MLILPLGGPVTFRNEPATSTSLLLRSRITRRCRVVAHVAVHLRGDCGEFACSVTFEPRVSAVPHAPPNHPFAPPAGEPAPAPPPVPAPPPTLRPGYPPGLNWVRVNGGWIPGSPGRTAWRWIEPFSSIGSAHSGRQMGDAALRAQDVALVASKVVDEMLIDIPHVPDAAVKCSEPR